MGMRYRTRGGSLIFGGSKLRGEMRRINFGIVAEVIGKKLAIHSLTEWVAIFEAYTAA
jgi:hypothetical protein